MTRKKPSRFPILDAIAASLAIIFCATRAMANMNSAIWDEVRPHYQKALMLAQSIEPEFQKGLISSVGQ